MGLLLKSNSQSYVKLNTSIMKYLHLTLGSPPSLSIPISYCSLLPSPLSRLLFVFLTSNMAQGSALTSLLSLYLLPRGPQPHVGWQITPIHWRPSNLNLQPKLFPHLTPDSRPIPPVLIHHFHLFPTMQQAQVHPLPHFSQAPTPNMFFP